jgi:hypothetical protein
MLGDFRLARANRGSIVDRASRRISVADTAARRLSLDQDGTNITNLLWLRLKRT